MTSKSMFGSFPSSWRSKFAFHRFSTRFVLSSSDKIPAFSFAPWSHRLEQTVWRASSPIFDVCSSVWFLSSVRLRVSFQFHLSAFSFLSKPIVFPWTCWTAQCCFQRECFAVLVCSDIPQSKRFLYPWWYNSDDIIWIFSIQFHNLSLKHISQKCFWSICQHLQSMYLDIVTKPF